MKRYIKEEKCLVIAWILTLVFIMSNATIGHAFFIESTNPQFGLNSITIDTDTGLEWLDLTITKGMAYNNVLTQLETGGTFWNYRVATPDEFGDLMVKFGFINLEPPKPAHDTFFDLFGATGTQDNYLETFGYTTDTNELVGVYGFDFCWLNGNPIYKLIEGSLRHNPSIAFDGTGTYLVRTTIPVPSTILLLCTGLVGLIGLRRRFKK